jgi:hypothetical protein
VKHKELLWWLLVALAIVVFISALVLSGMLTVT